VALLNDSQDHVPPVADASHDFEMSCVQRADRLDRADSFRRVPAAPPVAV
jgi:hypothetical protein